MKYLKQFVWFLFFPLFVTCNQDPIFFLVSKEVEPKEPTINGSPSKIARGSDGVSLYVANGKLWYFNGSGWSNISSPSSVYDVAFAGSELYVLQVEENSSTVYKHKDSSAVGNPTGYDRIQSIFGSSSGLFAAARKSGTEEYAILQLGGSSWDAKKTGNAAFELRGVAGSLFATATAGIFSGLTSVRPLEGTENIAVIALFTDSKIGSSVIAVTSSHGLLDINGSTVTRHNKGVSLSGAICVWEKTGAANPLLLVGINGGVNNYGYRELRIISGKVNFGDFYEPGDLSPDSSVFDKDKYKSQLEKYVIRSIAQPRGVNASGSSKMPVVFASTQKNGLWSYRADGDNAEGVWNAE